MYWSMFAVPRAWSFEFCRKQKMTILLVPQPQPPKINPQTQKNVPDLFVYSRFAGHSITPTWCVRAHIFDVYLGRMSKNGKMGPLRLVKWFL